MATLTEPTEVEKLISDIKSWSDNHYKEYHSSYVGDSRTSLIELRHLERRENDQKNNDGRKLALFLRCNNMLFNNLEAFRTAIANGEINIKFLFDYLSINIGSQEKIFAQCDLNVLIGFTRSCLDRKVPLELSLATIHTALSLNTNWLTQNDYEKILIPLISWLLQLNPWQSIASSIIGFMDKIVNINCIDDDGRTFLHKIFICGEISRGNQEVVKYLLKRGSVATIADKEGNTPILLLAKHTRNNTNQQNLQKFLKSIPANNYEMLERILITYTKNTYCYDNKIPDPVFDALIASLNARPDWDKTEFFLKHIPAPVCEKYARNFMNMSCLMNVSISSYFQLLETQNSDSVIPSLVQLLLSYHVYESSLNNPKVNMFYFLATEAKLCAKLVADPGLNKALASIATYSCSQIIATNLAFKSATNMPETPLHTAVANNNQHFILLLLKCFIPHAHPSENQFKIDLKHIVLTMIKDGKDVSLIKEYLISYKATKSAITREWGFRPGLLRDMLSELAIKALQDEKAASSMDQKSKNPQKLKF